jgi:hypothetical protein
VGPDDEDDLPVIDPPKRPVGRPTEESRHVIIQRQGEPTLPGFQRVRVRTDFNSRKELLAGPRILNLIERSDCMGKMKDFKPDVIDRIVREMVDNGHSLTKICKEKLVGPDTPSVMTVQLWMRASPEVYDIMSAARCTQAELKWDSLEEELEDMFYYEDEDGQRQFVDHHTARAKAHLARMKLDARRFEVSKMVRRAYGDEAPMPKTQLERLVGEGKIQIQHVVQVPDKKPETENVIELKNRQIADVVGSVDVTGTYDDSDD